MNSLKRLLLQSALVLTATEMFCMNQEQEKQLNEFSSYDHYYQTWSNELFGMENTKVDNDIAIEIIKQTVNKYPFQKNLNDLRSIRDALRNLYDTDNMDIKNDPLLNDVISLDETIKTWKKYIKNPEKYDILDYSSTGLKIIISNIKKKYEQFEDITMLHYTSLTNTPNKIWLERIKNCKVLKIFQKPCDVYYSDKKQNSSHYSKKFRCLFAEYKNQIDEVKNSTMNKNTFVIDLLCNFNEQIKNIENTRDLIHKSIIEIEQQKNKKN